MPITLNGSTGITTPGLTNDGSQTITNGTANGVAYLNGSKVLTTGSALTFDGTNLGIGQTAPGAKLEAAGNLRITNSSAGNSAIFQVTSDATGSNGVNLEATYYGSGGFGPIKFTTSNTERARIDSSGNLGLGVTPSAWEVGYNVLENAGGSFFSGSTAAVRTVQGGYINSGYKYKRSSIAAGLYEIDTGAHKWYTAPSGTAGAAISFTQAMTLDASGYLSLGTTVSQQTFNLQGGQRFYNPSADGVANTTIGRISSQTRNFGSGIATNSFASIEFCTQNDAAWYRGEIRFFTNGSDGTASYGTERARITSSGHLLVGTSDGSQSSGVGSKILGTGAFYAVGTGIDCFSYYNTGASQYRFFVGANGGISNYSGNNVNLSDRREKTNFAPAGEYLPKICAIPVQTYNYVDQDLETDPGLTLGVVAQDVQAVAPELVVESNWGTEENPKMRLSIYQTDLQYALMKCIQELKAELDSVKTELALLKGTA